MLRCTRAVGALLVTALIASGLALGVSPSAHATAPPAAQRVDLPVLSGTGNVGEPLTVLLAGLATVLPVQWLRDGTPIPGASGGTYVPTADDVGHAISALVAVPLLGDITTTAITVVAAPGDPGDPGDPEPEDPGDELLELVGGLGLPATAEVGQLVALTDPVWSLPGVTTTYQWLRDGAPIPGADDQYYIPTLEDAGHTIWAEVTGSLLGLPGVTVLTDALAIPAAEGPQLSPVGDVSVQGSRKVGTTLTLNGPTWDEDGVTNSYQWLRDGAPVGGATDPTYAVGAEDFGHSLSVQVTGSKEGFSANTITSDPVETVVGDALQFTMKPRVTGTAKAGKLLTADPGQWTGGTEGSGQPAYAYQWLRDGAVISGAVAQTYQVRKTDAGRALSVLVTATRPAYKAGRFTTAPVTVARLSSRLVAKLAKKKVRPNQAAVLRLVLDVAGIASPTGKVKVMDGRKVVDKAAFAKGKKGKLTVRLRKLEPGVHKLTAVYAGNATVAGTRSKVARLTVKKR